MIIILCAHGLIFFIILVTFEKLMVILKTSPKFAAMRYLQADMIITVTCVSVILSLEQH